MSTLPISAKCNKTMELTGVVLYVVRKVHSVIRTIICHMSHPNLIKSNQRYVPVEFNGDKQYNIQSDM